MLDDSSVKVRLRFKDALVPATVPVAGEGLWAKPLHAHHGGGTYVLHNNSFYAALGVGDLVHAEIDGEGLLQVTEVVMAAPVLISSFEVSARAWPTAGPMADGWRGRGANWSEGGQQVLVTVWEPGVDEQQVRAVLGEEEVAGRGWVRQVLGPDQRIRSAQEVVDFALDQRRHVPPTETSYGASGVDPTSFPTDENPWAG